MPESTKTALTELIQAASQNPAAAAFLEGYAAAKKHTK